MPDSPTRSTTSRHSFRKYHPVRIAEVFDSIQGEGMFTGTRSSFIRLSGCNLRCWFCDTPYTSWEPEGGHREWQSLVDEVLAFDSPHVVVTGGEPLLQPDVVPLTRALESAGRRVTVETAGTVFRPVAATLMSISPKRANSTPIGTRFETRHEQLRDQRDVIQRMLLEYDCQLKFVIDSVEDLQDVHDFVQTTPAARPDLVWLMPQARSVEELHDKSQWLQAAAHQHGYQFTGRLHIEMFGNVRGK